MCLKLITDPKELTLIKVIGQGSFGVVHLASWRGSLVAAKVIPVSQAELRKDVVQREIDILRLFLLTKSFTWFPTINIIML